MYFLADFSKKEKRNVKSHYRQRKDGKISYIKQYAKNFLIGSGLLGAGVLLGKNLKRKNIASNVVENIPQKTNSFLGEKSIQVLKVKPRIENVENLPKSRFVQNIFEENKTPITKQIGEDLYKGVKDLSVNEIEFDPKRFQYKILGRLNETGNVGSLSGVKKYDENLGGILQVWRDPVKNKTYVVNGHNRLDLAKRLGAEKVTVRYLDVPTAKEARAIGALTNIAEGRGDALDAAKFFKDTGLSRKDIIEKGIPMREKIAQDGLALADLDDLLFRHVIDGRLSIDRGVIIGRSGLEKTKQRSLLDMLSNRKKITDDVLQELVDTVKASEQQTQLIPDLFGGSEEFVDNAIERAKLQSFIKTELSKNKRLFGTVSKSKNTSKLTSAGNKIDVDTSKQISENADNVLTWFNMFKNYTGPINDILNDAANKIKSGGNERTIRRQAYTEIIRLIKEEQKRGGKV